MTTEEILNNVYALGKWLIIGYGVLFTATLIAAVIIIAKIFRKIKREQKSLKYK